MKIAIINMGNNVINFKTVPSSETIYLFKVISEMGLNVDIISLKNGVYTKSFDEVDVNDYDRLIVVNSSINFFGGKPNLAILSAQKFMAKYKSKIYYLFTDIRLPFSQSWPNVKNRPWAYLYTEEELLIKSPIKVISQGINLDIAKAAHKKVDNVIEFEYFPIEQYKIHMNDFQLSKPTKKTLDVIYGGSFRSGQRESKMVEFLFDTGLNIEFFGNAREKQFKNPKYPWTKAPVFTGKIPMNMVSEKNSQAIAALIIGDKNYNDNFITLRVWETMAFDAVMLIDEEFDTKHRIINDARFYVNNRAELIDRVNELKHSDVLRKEMLSIQHDILNKTRAKKAEWQDAFKKAIDL